MNLSARGYIKVDGERHKAVREFRTQSQPQRALGLVKSLL